MFFKSNLNNIRQGYSGRRPDIIKLIEIKKKSTTILDVGCGAGGIGKQLRKIYPEIRLIGIDSDQELLTQASFFYDSTFLLDLNSTTAFDQIENRTLDYIILADVLEHLENPSSILISLRSKLSNNGMIITCMPNIKHWSTFYFIYIKGLWPIHDRGIFDRTHKHFFTRKNMIDIFDKANLKILKERRNLRLIESKSWSNFLGAILDFHPFRSILTFQYIHVLCMK